MVKISIIVPIYGVEQYLRKCVDSLLNQDIPSSEYEIILVDDGSPDKCPQICDEYAAAHPNICVVHRPNGGLSAARNSGLEVAKGAYICFLDSDDYWVPDQLGALMKQIEQEQLDVLRFDHQNVRITPDGQYEVFQPYKHPHYVDRCHDIVDGATYLNERMGYACYACQFVMKRDLVSLFTTGIHFEDVDWLPRMMLNAKRVNSTETIVYNYLHRPGSITLTQGNKEKIQKNMEDLMVIIEKYNNYLTQKPSCIWLRRMQSNMVANVIATVASDLYPLRHDYIARLRTLRVFPLSIADQGKTYMRKARLINISPRLAIELLHLKNG